MSGEGRGWGEGRVTVRVRRTSVWGGARVGRGERNRESEVD